MQHGVQQPCSRSAAVMQQEVVEMEQQLMIMIYFPKLCHFLVTGAIHTLVRSKRLTPVPLVSHIRCVLLGA